MTSHSTHLYEPLLDYYYIMETQVIIVCVSFTLDLVICQLDLLVVVFLSFCVVSCTSHHLLQVNNMTTEKVHQIKI